MPDGLKPFYERELNAASTAFEKGFYRESWRYLERAHIIGQPYPVAHTLAHWRMLQFAIRLKKPHEILGQIPRLLVGGIKSFAGIIPLGNTGGADVPPLKPMEIPEDLAIIIHAHS